MRARPNTGGKARRMTSTRPAGRFASCAGGTTGTRRVVRDATRPFRSVVVVHSSRSPASVDQNSRSSRSRVPPNTTTAPVLLRIAAALCSPQRASSWARDWNAAQIVTPRPPMSAVQDSSGTGEMSAASSRNNPSGGSRRPPGRVTARRRASRAICP